MNILKPFYYDEFRCIGGKCKDSCCLGWTVFIDKKTFNEYKKVGSSFKSKLNSGISRNRKDSNDLHYGKMNLENGRCKFLNDKDLCDIYINLGEDYLCNTCKQYPRLLYKFGDVYEKTLNLSCPEVARVIVESNELFSFDMTDEILNETEKNIYKNITIIKIYINYYGRGDLFQLKLRSLERLTYGNVLYL